MMEHPPPPDPSTLLPPLLACLPTAFASHRPPPAVLPLLSPILRQRVQLLSTSTAASSESWLHHLCWESSEAEKLAEIVESDVFEPHPVSGEIELGDISGAQYRRLDEETLQSKLKVADLRLNVIYVWCEGDQEGGGNGWRVSEVKPAESISGNGGGTWWSSITQANEKSKEALKPVIVNHGLSLNHAYSNGAAAEEDDDDGYWAQYDNTPARTPAIKRSPAPNGVSSNTGHVRTASEAEYFAQYAQVQPEMDNDDPSGDREAIGESSLNGNTITGSIAFSISNGVNGTSTEALTNGVDHADHSIIHTRPSSSSSSQVVDRLEGSAASQSHAEIAVQQHISTSIKSLFRLARGAGIDKEEFERLVRIELETLNMMADDD